MSTDSTNDDKWVLGVVLGLLGSIAINTGNNIQSLGLKALKTQPAERQPKSPGLLRRKTKTFPVNEEKGENIQSEEHLNSNETSADPNPCSSTIWIIGTVVFVTGSILNFASYAFAAQSMLASLESIQFVTNLVFGKFMLKAIVTKRMLTGTVFTVAGTVIAVQFSSKKTLDLSVEDLIQLYGNPAYITYLVLMACSLVLLNKVFHHYEKSEQDGMQLKHTEIIMPFSYSIWSAIFGTQSVVQAKVLAELLALQSTGTENVFTYAFTYITLIVWLFTAWIWLYRLNNALSKFDPLFIIPLLQCSFIFFAIISGGIFFKEFNSFSPVQWIGFWAGVLISFSGLRLLIPVQQKSDASISPISMDDQSVDKNFDNDHKTLNVIIEHPIGDESPKICSPIRVRQDSVNRADMEKGGKQLTPVSEMGVSSIDANEKTSWTTPESYTKGNRISPSRIRTMRQSITQATVSAVKDIVVESAKGVVQGSSIFLTPTGGGGAAVLTDAMLAQSEHLEQRSNYWDKMGRLTALLNESVDKPEQIISVEVFELLHDLEIEVEQLESQGSWSISDLEAIRPNLSPRKFREEISAKISRLKIAESRVSTSLALDDKICDDEKIIV